MAKLPSLMMNQGRGTIYYAQGRDKSRPYGVANRSLFHVKNGSWPLVISRESLWQLILAALPQLTFRASHLSVKLIAGHP